jgi:glycosyltransferase involved in cell wall biosynthesis
VASRKVLIIVENASVPFDTRVWREASSLRASGHEVTVLCPRSANCRRGYEVLDGVHIYRHPMPEEWNNRFSYLVEYGAALWWEALYAGWIYLRRGFHVIQGCNPPDDIFLVALPFKLLGVRYIFDHHDANPELYASKYGARSAVEKVLSCLEKLTYRTSDVVICTNESYRKLALTRGVRTPEDVFIVRNGPELSTFKAVPPNEARKHGKAYLIGYVGTMGFQDGLDILLDVALHIREQGRRDIHFTCVGSGPALAGLRNRVKETGLEDMVEFTGRIPTSELLEILSTADVCVNPDRPCEMNEISTMIKIMEYMALGKPIVQFDLREGRYSAGAASVYACKEGGVADFSAKLLWLLDDPEERRKMGEFGLDRVKRCLAWDYSVEHLQAAYDRAFEKRQRTRRRTTAMGVEAAPPAGPVRERLVARPGVQAGSHGDHHQIEQHPDLT